MEAFLVSTGIVTLGEAGDKTQLLALLLAAKFKKPVPVILGILVANHAAAGALGVGQLQWASRCRSRRPAITAQCWIARVARQPLRPPASARAPDRPVQTGSF